MRYSPRSLSVILLTLMSSTSLAQSNTTASALIYSATVDFRHDSILTAIEAMKAQGLSYNIQFDNTEDASWFTDDKLAQYDLLVFLMNTGEVLDNDGQTAFQRYIDKGGNFVGIHAASDCLRNSTFFDKELGSHFDYHPEITNATVDVLDHSHPSTSMLPDQWHVYDEMYNFKSDPRSVGATVVLSANESSYNDPGPRRFNQGTPHPTAWYQEHGAGADVGGVAGRSFYTSLGHTNDTWKDNLFLGHVMGGISWAVQSGTTRATNASALVGSSASSSHSSASTSASPSATTGSIPSATQASTALTTLAAAWISAIIPVTLGLFILLI